MKTFYKEGEHLCYFCLKKNLIATLKDLENNNFSVFFIAIYTVLNHFDLWCCFPCLKYLELGNPRTQDESWSA